MTTGYKEAKKYIGLEEHRDKEQLMKLFLSQKIMDPRDPRKPLNPDDHLKDGLAWCAGFVGLCEREAGNKGTGSLMARSYLKYGKEVDLTDAREGDIVVFERGNNGYSGHVAYYVSYDPKTKMVRTLGGNQSDAVSYAYYKVSQLLGVRRV